MELARRIMHHISEYRTTLSPPQKTSLIKITIDILVPFEIAHKKLAGCEVTLRRE